jgi:xanthine dehydrogenase accessory factor
VRDFYQHVLEWLEQGQRVAIALIVQSKGSTPRKPGTRMAVFADAHIEGSIGGGVLEQRVIEEALRVLASSESRLIHYDLKEETPDSIGAICGGEVWVYIEPLVSSPRLLILGGGHVGRVLARMAVELELRVVVYDDRPEVMEPGLFPPSITLRHGSFEQAMAVLQPQARDWIAIMTYNHQHDYDLLCAALSTPARYIGVVASRKKMAEFRERLIDRGFPMERIEQIHGPIGLKIGGNHPAEIAISILAEIIQEKYQKDASSST